MNGHTLGFHPQTLKLEPPCTAHDKQYHRKLLLNSFHFNGHTLDFLLRLRLRTICSQATKSENCFCATGLFTAAFDVQVEWLAVKGISNFSDESESVNEDWRTFASAMAASVVGKILNDSIVFRQWPHYQGNDNLADRTVHYVRFPQFQVN